MRNLTRFLSVVLVCLSISTVSLAKDKERAWQDGVLLDSDTKTGTRVVGSAGSINTLRNDLTYDQLDTGKMIYVVARTLRRRSDNALDVTINGHVQFAIEGSTCYLKDDKGKEHKLSVEKKIAK
jgi:hypothetical protein